MIALAVDENFDHHILRALVRRIQTLDVRTVTAAAYERVARGEPMPGVIEVRARSEIGDVLADLELIVLCATEDDLRDRVVFVPLS